MEHSTSCCLCGKYDHKGLMFSNFTEDEKFFIEKHYHGKLPGTARVCRRHKLEAMRYHSDEKYVPKWKKENNTDTKEVKACMFPNCQINSDASKVSAATFAPVEQIQSITGVTESSILLCKSHYNEVYKIIVNPEKCAFCQAKPKAGKPFIRHSPDSKTISEIFGLKLEQSDSLCLVCYKAQLTLLKEIEQNSDTFEDRLKSEIEKWQVLQSTSEQKLTKSLLQTVIYVANHILQDKALLLSSVSVFFVKEYTGCEVTCSASSIDLTLETEDSNLKFSSKWLLNSMIIYLNDYFQFKCIHKKFGTIIYRRDGDIMTSLSWALGSSVKVSDSFTSNYSYNSDEMLHQSALVINGMIHNDIHRITQLPEYHFLTLNDLLEETNNQLLTFFKTATQSVRNRRSSRTPVSDGSKHLKIAFLISTMINCTNSQILTPIHYILADIIETSGGSHELLRVFNRLGCVSSPDSHDRYVTYHAKEEQQKQLWTKLSPSIITVASVDNFDMLQTHSAVYQGKQHRSYHGTTIQLVQPIPEEITTTQSQLNVTLDLSANVLNTTTPLMDIQNLPLTQQSRRRQVSFSPSSSPHKLGKDGPKRQRTIEISSEIRTPSSQPSPYSVTRYAHLTHEDFTVTLEEKEVVKNIDKEVIKYMFHKTAAREAKIVLPLLRHFLKTNCSSEPSNIHYLNIVSENADDDTTLLKVSEDLIEAFENGAQQDWVLLTGDGKTYQHLTSIKNMYGESLKKLLVFPGDWHTLKNFQETLMKVYYTAGLKEIAEASGYRGATLTSLEKCSNFKRTHNFIVQLWEAMYRALIIQFIKKNGNSTLMDNVQVMLQNAIATSKSRLAFMVDLDQLISEDIIEEFKAFIDIHSKEDEVFQFWTTFLFTDCQAYIYLFLAVRGRNWNLRNASLKAMLPTFAAFDRNVYQRLIPHHIAECHLYPKEVKNFLNKGGFTVQIRNEKWKAVGMDEAHEMCINKKLKEAITYPTEAYLQKSSLFLNKRIKSQESFLKELFPERDEVKETEEETIKDKSSQGIKVENNIVSMINIILENNMLQFSPGRILTNPFSHQVASNEQRHDLLQFHQIGKDAAEQYISTQLIKQSSGSGTVRQKKLLTFSSQHPKNKKRKTKIERENEVVIKCLRRRLAWCQRNNQQFSFTDEIYSIYPRALSDQNGIPHKSAKSHWNEKLKTRYATYKQEVFSSSIPSELTPQAVVIDAMFLINTKPLRNTKTIPQYTKLLFARFIQEHFKRGVSEVHVVFDKPIRIQFNPKKFEHERRDLVVTNHTHRKFESNFNIDIPWSELIGCRACKYNLVQSIGQCFLRESRYWIQGSQHIVLSGCFSDDDDNLAWVISSDAIPQPEPLYHTNSEEADLRVWMHAVKCQANNVLIYSPDTDISIIGLQLLTTSSKKFIIQLNMPSSSVKSYLFLSHLLNALTDDSDLSSLASIDIPKVITSLFVATGSDYTSYFKNFGKATVLNTFFMHCKFISGANNHEGSLSDFTPEKRNMGFLSFLRLVRTLYFKRHLTSFACISNVQTPEQLFNSTDQSLPALERHKAFVDKIQAINGERIISEEERMPSITALHRHWLRSTYISNMWSNATEYDVYVLLPLPEESGWILTNGTTYSIDWEDPVKQDTVSLSLHQMTNGCKCKTGCTTGRCRCKKKNTFCSPGCYCTNCLNSAISANGHNTSDTSESDSEQSDIEEHIETEVITDTTYVNIIDDLL